MNAAYSPGKLDVSLQGQPEINLSLLPGAGKEKITVNGKRNPASETLRNGLIHISPQPSPFPCEQTASNETESIVRW
jgi:hypothetical protein